jgi:hypothetical protein
MNIEPLKKELFNKAKKLGVEQIVLHFSGGNDEGYLNVETLPNWNQELANEVEEWAWEVYGYNGAGDGSDYGDDITYDLANNRATAQEWYTARTEGELIENAFELDESE